MTHPTLSLAPIYNPAPGWYRGDLHAHTVHSDGRRRPAELVAEAKRDGLDFIAITDHNNANAFAKFAAAPELLVIPGMEITLTTGHFNVWGLEEKHYDWMEDLCVGLPTVRLAGRYRTPTALMRQMTGQGLLTSLNHPLRQPYGWADRETELRCLNCIEIWNRPDTPDLAQPNRQAVALWTAWLNAGHRLTAVGGSDYHSSTLNVGEQGYTERLGRPCNYVYADNLSGATILAGLRQGRAYVTLGPQLTLTVQANGLAYGLGDDLGDLDGQVVVTATYSGAARAQLVKNGEVMASAVTQGEGGSFEYRAELKPTEPAWYRLELYGPDDTLVAITNPIFSGRWPQPTRHTYGDFV